MAMPPNTCESLALDARADATRFVRRAGKLALALAVTSLCTGCSHLPEPGWPMRSLGEIEVVYDLDGSQTRRVRIPQSDEDLSLLELSADRAGIAEEYVDGQRFWLLPASAERLHVRCRYRLFLEASDPTDRPALDPARSFPGARVLRHTARIADHDDS